ncbi:MAG: UDP-N-acetylmuramoyl-L-alanine--D-glutamate ligase [Pseudomonadota bacterium]
MRIEALAGQRVVVLGFGREGQSTYQVLSQRGQCADLSVWTEAGELPSGLPGKVASLDTGLGAFDVAIRSPGIRADHPALVAFREGGGRVLNPATIFLSERPEARIVGVTGSKGKSTTASLMAHLLRANGQQVVLAGNIGVPLLDHLDSDFDVMVAELSSYQLADLEGLLSLGLITRLFPEHLDWHGSEAAYYGCKLRLAALLSGRPLLINGQDPILEQATRSIEGRVMGNQPSTFHRDGDGLFHGSESLLTLNELQLIGRHNLDNAALALQAAELLGADRDVSLQALRSFKPLVHRLERITGPQGSDWVNDSIATSPHATRAALESLRDQRVVLIAGGLERSADWSPVVGWCRDHPLAGLITLPDNGRAVVEALVAGAAVDASAVRQVDDIESAVACAASQQGSGETVLLSPGAPSFPQFRDFEERGDRFRKAIADLAVV